MGFKVLELSVDTAELVREVVELDAWLDDVEVEV